MKCLTPVALLTAALLSGCAAEMPTYPSDLEYQYVPIEKGMPAAALQTPMPVVPGSHPSNGPVTREKVVKPKTNAQAMRAALKAAETNPTDCDFENSVMVCPFEKGRIYNVFVKAGNLASPSLTKDGQITDAKVDAEQALVVGNQTDTPGNPTLFMLQPGEKIVNIGFDNYDWFSLPPEGEEESGIDPTSVYGGGGDSQAIIPVRGWKAGERTGMWILTNRRTYLIRLHTNRYDYNRAVAWHYRDDPETADNMFTGSAKAAGMVVDPVDPARLKPYDVSGPAEWLPEKWGAWHDGEKLRLIPPAEIASRPVPFVRRDGNEGKTRWDVAADGSYVIYGRPAEVFMHEGDKTRQITFRARP